MSASAFAVVTGGGTAGHVVPALAIADALVAHGHRAEEIFYIGARRGIETRLLPPTPYPHRFLDVIGLQRRFTPSNLTLPVKLIKSVAQARRLLKSLRPAVVVCVGGYASFPATLAAALCRIPIVVVSYDRMPGLASRISARFATASAVSFEGSTLSRARYTGAPVRRELSSMEPPGSPARIRRRAAARASMGLPDDRFVIAAFGGSLGSKVLNDAVARLVDDLRERRDLAVRHVVGERYLDQLRRPGATERPIGHGIMYDMIGYEDRMEQVYAAADLVIARAGASTVVELATVGMASILVPWAGAAGDHQSDNARMLGEAGAAVVIAQDLLGGDALTTTVRRLAGDPQAVEQLATAAYDAGEAHRSGRLTALIEEVAAGR